MKNEGLANVSRWMEKPERQINDMLSKPPRKTFGEKVAKAMEEAYAKNCDSAPPPGWLVSPSDRTVSTLSARQPRRSVHPAIAAVVQLMEDADEDGKQMVLSVVQAMLKDRTRVQKANAQ